MHTNVLLDLSDASDHANGLLLSAVDDMTQGERNQHSSPSHGTVTNLLRHMFTVEAAFLHAAGGLAEPHEIPKLDSASGLREAWEDLSRTRRAFLSALSADDLAKVISLRLGGSILRLPRYQLLLQAITHSMHHRGELSIVCTQLGHPLPTLDCILHFVESSGQQWPG